MKKSRKILLIIDALLILAVVLFIFINSSLSVEASSEESGSVFDAFKGIFDFIFGEGVITHQVFRKLTHGTEFFILALLINFLFLIIEKFNLKSACITLSVGLFVAVTDESIQLLSGRGPLVTDVLIDFGGVLAVTIIFTAIYYLVIKIKNNKNKT